MYVEMDLPNQTSKIHVKQRRWSFTAPTGNRPEIGRELGSVRQGQIARAATNNDGGARVKKQA